MAVKKAVIDPHIHKEIQSITDGLCTRAYRPWPARTESHVGRSNGENIFRFSPVWLISIYNGPDLRYLAVAAHLRSGMSRAS
jgi:hypothetical protein